MLCASTYAVAKRLKVPHLARRGACVTFDLWPVEYDLPPAAVERLSRLAAERCTFAALNDQTGQFNCRTEQDAREIEAVLLRVIGGRESWRTSARC